MHPVLMRLARALSFLTADPSALPQLPAPVTREVALELTALPFAHNLDLFTLARQITSVAAPAPFTCGIINAKSGHCAENCAFCAQSAHHDAKAPQFPLLPQDDIVRRAHALKNAGASRFGIVTSGTALSAGETDALCQSIERVRKETSLEVCASIGMLNPQQARLLRSAGLDRYHHNLETAASHFPSVCSTHSYDEDLASLAVAREAGLALCSGGIFGLGETWEQRVELALTLADQGVESIPVNFLNPIPGTPLAKQPLLSPAEALRIIALLRLMHPGRDIIICGGRNTVLGEWDSWLFAAGANAMMTGDYLTTTGSPYERDVRMLQALAIPYGKTCTIRA